LKEKEIQRISNPESNIVNNQGEANVLPEDQPNSPIDLINPLKEVKLKILNKINKK
jgi:hypothetical protein